MPMLQPPRINVTAFFENYRALFVPPGTALRQHTVEGLDYLLYRFNQSDRWTDLRHVAYALATIRTETGVVLTVMDQRIDQTYHPIEELGGRTYLSKYYLKPSLRRALGNIKLADAWTYKGRGYVQITGRRNYTLFAGLLGVDLVNHPKLATDPTIAFDIMTEGMFGGLFTGHSLADHINDERTDYCNARRIINGTDRARSIGEDAIDFHEVLRRATA